MTIAVHGQNLYNFKVPCGKNYFLIVPLLKTQRPSHEPSKPSSWYDAEETTDHREPTRANSKHSQRGAQEMKRGIRIAMYGVVENVTIRWNSTNAGVPAVVCQR